MSPARRWAAASLALSLVAAWPIETARGQAPPKQGAGQGQGGARRDATKGRPARRRPRPRSEVGLIVPYPFPPALIIRQTPEAHEEVQALLRMLRGGRTP